MGIYRGPGGTGDAVNDASSEALITVQAKDAALAAQAAAEAAQAAAELAETNAETAETNAETAETNAETAATNAANSASAASTSASNAASSASAASTSASNASTSASNAASSASAASTSASNAASSASTATTQATNASNSASAAATSATNASNSASAAATSATNAANSATAAQTAQTAAELAETNAETAETNAETAETNAAASASAAATSASNASTSASNAATSATNASNSASAAATSATNASNSASAAATSATNASNSASAAATSATNAAASYDSFDDRYLGAKSSAPTLDNDGNTLLVGALYYDTVSSSMKVWSGSAWLDAYASLSGALLATNNLSDLNNTATARTNLGVAIGVNVQAWDADLDTWATKTAPSGTVVGTSDSQTLTNKTLTTPVISTISNTGTLTLPTSTDTLVGRATSDTLTNKTIALGSNTVSGTLAQFNTAVTDADLVSIAGTETLTNKTLTSPTINTATISGGTINNTPIGGTTAAAGAFTTLSASGVATISAGTVSAPALTTTGDTNTGIFFPAADTIAFTEGGVESMRIDSSGNVGIGTSSPTASRLHIAGYNGGTTYPIRMTSSNSGVEWTFETGGSAANSSFLAFRDMGNSAERMRIDASGNVSIGTTSAYNGSRFRVYINNSNVGNASSMNLTQDGTGDAAIGFLIGATTEWLAGVDNSDSDKFKINNITGGGDFNSNGLTIDTSGNVGIGTSSPNISGFNRTLTISATGTDQTSAVEIQGNRSVADTPVGRLDFLNSTNLIGFIQARRQTNANDGSLHFYTANAGTNTERLVINSSGNVGIGTSSPASKLDVVGVAKAGTLQASGSAAGSFSANSWFVQNEGSSITRNYYCGANGSTYGILEEYAAFSNGTPLRTRYSTNDTQIFYTSNAERMRIDSSGNVGIGTSSPSSFGANFRILELQAGSSSAGGGYYLTGNGTAQAQMGVDTLTGYIGMRSNHPIAFTTNNTERMRIDSSGNVGIGTNNPSGFNARTAIRDDSKACLNLSSTGNGARVVFENIGTDAYGIGMPSGTGALAFFSSNVTERMRITAGGNVGIGTTNPSTALHVNGAGTFTGNLSVSTGNATGGGIILADDGDIVDNNDGFCSMRFSSGVRVYSANRGGSPVITLSNGGTVTASNFIGSGVSRAWVYFNGQGGASIMGSYNVGSVTRWTNAQYTINFTSAMPDGNYAATGMTYDNGNNGRVVCYDNSYTGNATTGLGISVVDFGYNRFESNRISVVVFR